MKPERKKELEEQAEARTPEDKLILHILFTHFVDAFSQLTIAEAEAMTLQDERAAELIQLAQLLRNTLEESCENIISTIPGVMTKEEAAKEMEQAQLRGWLDSAIGRPADDDEHLH
jgi:hypothetical protein